MAPARPLANGPAESLDAPRVEVREMWLLRGVLILCMLLLPAGPFEADTFPVTKTDDTNDGTCDADCSLREAIEAANANPGADDVPVPAGTYRLTLGQLLVSGDVSIAGAGQTSTILDGNASSRVFDIGWHVAAEISGVTIQNGSAGSGGGISSSGDLALSDSTVSGNTASVWSGGGIEILGHPLERKGLTLTNSTVSGNTAAGWGGGGIYQVFGAVTLTDSTVSGNRANSGDGGGISTWDGGLTLIDSTVRGNAARDGGGIWITGDYGIGYLTNSTVSGNTAYDRGGGIHNEYNAVTFLTNSTVSGNTAANGGGLSRDGGYYFQIENSIVAGNSTENCNNPFGTCYFCSLGHNLTDDTSCGFSATGDLVVADAMLGPLADNGGPTETHDLLPGSPAIDAAADAKCPAADQRGEARPFDGDGDGTARCDIGAVEYVPEPGRGLLLGAGALCLFELSRRRARRSLRLRD